MNNVQFSPGIMQTILEFYKSGPKEDPRGQPLVVSYHSLVVSGSILTLHFLSQKYDCIKPSTSSEKP